MSTGMFTTKTRDIVQLIDELWIWNNVHVRHSIEQSLAWNGITKDQQTPKAAEDANRQATNLLKTLQP
ncbi:uncharacterized protein Z518_10853 [Rhinocladiella mackenziei CBS 650.93]|uniref:Uncharacterized protein n=1 Tax=Rhinocladiella mackenziei CBS 650.93 TaxID=1442369 RepID=A0A0D2I9I6_9EURO|nr:uncharacterized protein Z518_10853 [Rhinocladiella mackenziei CBS 650.93]KIW99925.1 hypothetical protein Z518_10853 [Rhinocladiella mackenziei CBS 650.93]